LSRLGPHFFSQEKAKPAVRQGRKITDLVGDSRVALKKATRLFFSEVKNQSATAAIILSNTTGRLTIGAGIQRFSTWQDL